MKLYICGPMSGLPQFNIPLFDTTAAELREENFEVVSPAELDSPEMRAFAIASPDGQMPADGKIAGESWGDVLARDVRLIHNEIDGIVVLPGWHKSRGARLECFVGLLTGKQFFRYNFPERFPEPYAIDEVRRLIRENMP